MLHGLLLGHLSNVQVGIIEMQSSSSYQPHKKSQVSFQPVIKYYINLVRSCGSKNGRDRNVYFAIVLFVEFHIA